PCALRAFAMAPPVPRSADAPRTTATLPPKFPVIFPASDCHWLRRRDLLTQLQAPVQEVLRGGHLVGQTPFERGLSTDEGASQHHLSRTSYADGVRQQSRLAPERSETHLGVSVGKARLGRGNDETAAQRHFQRARHTGPVHGRNGWFTRGAQYFTRV